MKVIFLTEGGKGIGFGHITRCIALSQAFEEKKIKPMMAINGGPELLKLVRNKNYRLCDWLDRKKLPGLIKGTEIIIVDSYLADSSLYEEILNLCQHGTLVYIDDYNRIKYPKGMIINPSVYGNEVGYIRNQESAYLLGKDYIILRKEFWKTPKKRINKKIKDVMVTLGGMDQDGYGQDIIKHVEKKFGVKCKTAGVGGKRYSASGMLKLMLGSDICISGGGQTTYELARVGVPSICACMAKNQILNIKSWEKKGFIKYAGWYNSPDLLQKLDIAFNDLFSQESRIAMSETGRRLVDGMGPGRIIKEILSNLCV